jgi:hypothetical protein
MAAKSGNNIEKRISGSSISVSVASAMAYERRRAYQRNAGMSIIAGMAAALSEMAYRAESVMASRGAHQQWRNGVQHGVAAWRQRGMAAWHQRKIISISAAAKAQNVSDLKAKSGSESVTGGVIGKYVKEKITASAGVSMAAAAWRRHQHQRGNGVSNDMAWQWQQWRGVMARNGVAWRHQRRRQ